MKVRCPMGCTFRAVLPVTPNTILVLGLIAELGVFRTTVQLSAFATIYTDSENRLGQTAPVPHSHK